MPNTPAVSVPTPEDKTKPSEGMKNYLAFPVRVNPETGAISSRPAKDMRSYRVSAQNYEMAYQEASNHLALFEGESLAVVLSK